MPLLNGTNVFTGSNTFTGTLYASPPYLKFAEVTTNLAVGASVAGTNNWRKFNLELTNTHNFGSTNGTGNINLPAGTYQCRISAPAFRVEFHQIRLRTSTGTSLLFGGINHLETSVDITPVLGPSVLKGLELIGATDDLEYPERRPSLVTIVGGDDGHFDTPLATVSPAAPSANSQITEFLVTNATPYTQCKINFGEPVDGDRLQVGELRLFGEAFVPSPTIAGNGTQVDVKWRNTAGFQLEFKTNLLDAMWLTNTTAPTLVNGTNRLSLPALGPSKFFRLRKP